MRTGKKYTIFCSPSPVPASRFVGLFRNSPPTLKRSYPRVCVYPPQCAKSSLPIKTLLSAYLSEPPRCSPLRSAIPLGTQLAVLSKNAPRHHARESRGRCYPQFIHSTHLTNWPLPWYNGKVVGKDPQNLKTYEQVRHQRVRHALQRMEHHDNGQPRLRQGHRPILPRPHHKPTSPHRPPLRGKKQPPRVRYRIHRQRTLRPQRLVNPPWRLTLGRPNGRTIKSDFSLFLLPPLH